MHQHLMLLSSVLIATGALLPDEHPPPTCAPGAQLLTMERRTFEGAPPTAPPEDLLYAYTRCGAIPLSDFYVDDTRGGKGTRYTHGSKDIEARIQASQRELQRASLAGLQASRAHLVGALKLPLVRQRLQANASVVVFGSTSPTVETLLLAAGAAHVFTVEYNELVYKHPQLTTATVREVEEAWRGGSGGGGAANTSSPPRIPPPGTFDLACSISSFDHDGLGRYGDPLAPDGDLMAMHAMAQYLKPGGLALVSVPVGPDRVWWNLMRTYGPVRLPLLLEGWQVLDRVGWRGGEELLAPAPAPAGQQQQQQQPRSPGVSHEPVFVLRRQEQGKEGLRPEL